MNYCFIGIEVEHGYTWIAPANIKVVSIKSNNSIAITVIGTEGIEYEWSNTDGLVLRQGDTILFESNGYVSITYSKIDKVRS
jgi:hypothetical protein